jgi:hypothetical protein
MLKSGLLLLMLLFGCVGFAQQTAVVVKSSEPTQLFQASMNNFLLNQTPVNNLKVTGLIPQGKYFLEVRFYNDTQVFKTAVNLLDVGFYHQYEVDKNGIRLRKIAPNYEAKESNQLVVKFGAKPIDTLTTDTIVKDSLIAEQTDHYQLADYDGKVGCPWPMKDDDFAAFKLNMQNQRLEDDKLNYSKEYLANNCLLTKQIAELMMVFEYEETKLDFAISIYPNTFDVDNFISTLRSSFKFESSLDKLKQQFNIVEKKK